MTDENQNDGTDEGVESAEDQAPQVAEAAANPAPPDEGTTADDRTEESPSAVETQQQVDEQEAASTATAPEDRPTDQEREEQTPDRWQDD